jgi:hypothetical protein
MLGFRAHPRRRVNGYAGAMDGTIDEALALFSRTGPEFGPGLSNHGPMAAEALIALGREEAVEPWAAAYRHRLVDAPESRHPIAPEGWREALGDITRVGDWTAFFERELADVPWRTAIDAWVERLAPGIMAGATHGFLRTAHAVRSLERGETPVRVHELAEGLAYWAARYQELPRRAGSPGTMRIAQALARVPHVEGPGGRGLIFDAVKAVATVDFERVIGDVDTTIDAGEFVSDITHTFVREYLANADRAAIAFVHTVTAPSAIRMVAPYLSDDTRRLTLACAWQSCAAIYATYGGGGAAQREQPDAGAYDVGDLVSEAVASGDEHAIKFTEACLREYALAPDPMFLAGARDASRRLRA